MSAIFGGSKQKSYSSNASISENRAFPFLMGGYGNNAANSFNEATSALRRETAGGFDGYRDKTGFDFFEKLGLNKVGGQFSGRGAFQSGAALKSLANYENNLEKASYDSYLDKLFQQAQLGVGAGQAISGAGGRAASRSAGTSSGSQSDGFGGFLGSIIGGVAASDRRLKKSVNKVGELPNGLGLYEYWYINDTGPYIGVMADEVEAMFPEALGPVVDGYKTVNYDKIKELM